MNQEILLFREHNLNKKIVIIYGNCHTTAIAYKLSMYKPFNDKYVLFPMKAVQDIENPEYLKLGMFDICDVFIHQSIRKENKYGIEYSSNEVIKLLRNDCKIISIPNLYHLPMCFFPQFSEEKDFVNRTGDTVFFRDKILDNINCNYKYLSQALDKYMDENFYNHSYLNKQFAIFMEKVRFREKEWDVKISDFIINNYRNKQLFYDPNHPTPILINHITCEILNELSVILDIEIIDSLDDMRLDSFEIPICASVKACFSFPVKKEIRITGNKVRNKPMNLEEYIHQYYSLLWQNKRLNLIKRTRSFLVFLSYKIQKKIWSVRDE